MKQRCKVTLKSGKQCPRYAVEGHTNCKMHGGKKKTYLDNIYVKIIVTTDVESFKVARKIAREHISTNSKR